MKTTILVLHEIYGVNAHSKDYCEALRNVGFHVEVINFLQRVHPFRYEEEIEAYRSFMEDVGFQQAVHTVNKRIRNLRDENRNVILIGFSIGATVAWLCGKEDNVVGIIGYYGSRIRDYVHQIPKAECLLFYPHVEKSFSVDALVDKLKAKGIITITYPVTHGFSDPYSEHFDKVSAKEAFKETIAFINRNRL
ncbi:hypothetical protein DH09_12400 [Bacillaceae bacterium JMAK1]|nr:hypothetical protein DH09_12400 [Bacillaceae bacterium JMAK1]